MIAPVVQEHAKNHPEVAFVKVDIDDGALADIVSDHAVAAVPTFVGYKGVKKLGSFSGADKNELDALVGTVL